MNAAVSRNPTIRFSGVNEKFDYNAGSRSGGGGWRIFSKRQSGRNLMTSWSYRRDRARKRRIFLQTYKLGYFRSDGEKLLRSRKLKKVAVKAKSAVVSALEFVRGGAFRSCNFRAAIQAASPHRSAKFG
ncbi:hypothetical protein SASPL_153940 [Salvia splendens]|uniref:Uncharacterized protein n=1 Tax=Salvia splendens TaxID=180675 RepID=A0A8X8VZ76_SALSN|nr:hypothetical protein SASPL_153940 [Salvia splendens]